ncbi:MAG: hypothetical protein RLZZ214_3485 [Verrucomicrobiota bacterium]
MFAVLRPLERFLVTTTVSKHRLFGWACAPTNPDHQLIVFARADDYFFGVLHSRIHEAWALGQGTQLREKESGFRYTPTTCFETFPMPEPTPEHEAAISAAARELNDLRERWLNPPEWTREEILEFPATPDGPWARFVAPGSTTARWPRRVPIDAAHAAKLAKRTLTNLYNERPAWLAHAHAALDAAVCQAYGWPVDLTNEEVLARLLEKNRDTK